MKHYNNNNIKGQTLVIVITFLALLFVVGIAFFTLSQAERAASIRHLESLKVRYITEAGISYALKVLKLDRQANLIDSLEDLTSKHFSGEEADLDADGKPESRWFNVVDSQGNPCGRFAIKISDEASKININTADTQTLEQLFSQTQIDASKADTLLERRPFNAIEQIGPILGKSAFAGAKDFLTVYSRDREIDLQRKRRLYLNSSSAQVIFGGFLNAGIRSPHQKAANLKDASDADLCQTRLDEFVRGNILPTQVLESGSWVKLGNFYKADAGGTAGKFVWLNLPIEDGDYYCFLYGPEAGVVFFGGEVIFYNSGIVGEVYLDGEEKQSEFLFL